MLERPEFHELSDYKLWLQRANAAITAEQLIKISVEQRAALQRFVIEFGQFNANFTHDELSRLNYPKSPFNLMHRHAYLRGTETWAVEMMRKWFGNDQPEVKYAPSTYPIFLDSPLFWDELTRYVTVVDEQNLDRAVDVMTTSVWVRLSKPEEKPQLHERIQTIIAHHVIDQQFSDKPIQDILKKSTRTYPESEKQLIQEYLPTELQAVRDQYEQKQAKRNQPNKNKEGKIDLEQNTLYAQAIDRWKKQNTSDHCKQIYYFVQSDFMGVATLVLVGHREAKNNDAWGPKTLVNQLGYRLDHAKATRIVLQKYSKLFFDPQQTKAFWKDFSDNPMVTGLKTIPAENKTEFDIVMRLPGELDRQKRRSKQTELNIIKTGEYQSLSVLLKQRLPENFEIYAQFLFNYCQRFDRLYRNHSLMQCVAALELRQSVRRFIAACDDNNMVQAIRAVQTVCEILRLDLALNPLPAEQLLTEHIKKKLLAKFPVQSVSFMAYGMRSYARVLQLEPTLNTAQSPALSNIAVTIQNYFESLINLGLLHNKKAIVQHFRHLSDIDSSADLIFMEIHPNNVTERKQFSQDLTALLTQMKSAAWQKKQHTIAIDATLNALDDDEVQQALALANPLINDGLINIVLIQSLTKFAQAGVDERNGGVMVVLNNNDNYWQRYNQQCKKITDSETNEPSSLQFFSYFFLQDGLIDCYLRLINTYTLHVYTKVSQALNALEVGTTQRFQLTMSSDARGCYIALNLRGVLPCIDPGFELSAKDLETFGGDIIEQVLIPLCEFAGLPLTQRMSIGFPLSSVNNIQDSLRFTVGLEPSSQLNKYAEIIAYISFSLNRFRQLSLLFEKDSTNKFNKRVQFFAEKVAQFKAMTPDSNYIHELEFEQRERDRPDRRKITMHNGELTLQRLDYNQRAIDYNNESTKAYIAGHQNAVPLSKIEPTQRRMIAACFSALLVQNEQSVKCVFDDLRRSLTLSFHILNLAQDTRMIYGPFQSNRGQVFFQWHDNHVTFFTDQYRYDEGRIIVKQGQVRINFNLIPLEDRVFLFNGASYSLDRSATTFKEFLGCHTFHQQINFYQHFPEFKYISAQHSPLRHDRIRLHFTENDQMLVMERDFVCFQGLGITVYKRYFDEQHTGIEIDCWQEKDPVVHRYLSFVIAVCVNVLDQPQNKKVGFKARGFYNDPGPTFTHYLFQLSFDAVDDLFQRAITHVMTHRASLLDILEQRANANSTNQPTQRHMQYPFFSEPHDTCTNTDAYHHSWLNEGELVQDVEQVLRLGSFKIRD